MRRTVAQPNAKNLSCFVLPFLVGFPPIPGTFAAVLSPAKLPSAFDPGPRRAIVAGGASGAPDHWTGADSFGSLSSNLKAHRAAMPGRRLCSSAFRAAENLQNTITNMVKKSDLCVRYGVSRRTIENWTTSGILPFWKPSYGIVRFDLEKCDKALGRFERKSVASDN